METMNIDAINVDNQYLRLETNVDKLIKSIETVGIIHPLVINQENKLISGGRRYTALKQMGISEVPVIKIDKTDMEQELISIDENLVRQNLNKIEMEECLSRGREIYETLYPDAVKFEEEDLTTPEQNEIKSELPNEKRSFIDLTAEKTGLSKKVIKSAIDREEKSSDTVKKLREAGTLNASQTNEIIKLDKEAQEKIAHVVEGKSAKEIKQLVKEVSQKGVDLAVEDYLNAPHLPKEYKSLQTLLTRVNKNLGKILIEEIRTNNEDVDKIIEQVHTLRMSLDQFLILTSNKSSETYEQEESEVSSPNYDNYEEVVADAMSSFSNDPSSEMNSLEG